MANAVGGGQFTMFRGNVGDVGLQTQMKDRAHKSTFHNELGLDATVRLQQAQALLCKFEFGSSLR